MTPAQPTLLDLLARLDNHLRQMAPHVRERETAQLLQQAADLLRALREEKAAAATPAVPEGYVMVPKEPSDAMIHAAIHCLDGVNLVRASATGNRLTGSAKEQRALKHRLRYRAMLTAAAPAPTPAPMAAGQEHPTTRESAGADSGVINPPRQAAPDRTPAPSGPADGPADGPSGPSAPAASEWPVEPTRYNERGEVSPDGILVFYSDWKDANDIVIRCRNAAERSGVDWVGDDPGGALADEIAALRTFAQQMQREVEIKGQRILELGDECVAQATRATLAERALEEARDNATSACAALEEQCHYCGVLYPKPVLLHHTQNECDNNKKYGHEELVKDATLLRWMKANGWAAAVDAALTTARLAGREGER